MKITDRSSFETRLVELLHHKCNGDQIEALREEFVVEKIRDLRNGKDAPIAEYRLDGRDVLDMLRDDYGDEVKVLRVDNNAGGTYWSSDIYDIGIGNLRILFRVSLRNGEECNAAELYYGHCYLFNVIFMTPELVVELIMQAADLYDDWMKTWTRVVQKAQRCAKIKMLSETAIIAYLKNKIIGTNLEYTITDRKDSLDINLKLEWGLKIVIGVNQSDFREKIDEAVCKVNLVNEAMRQLNDVGKVKKVSATDIWLTE